MSDAKANNLPEHLLNRVKRKWSYQDRKDCLDTWHDTLDPKNLAKLFRVATSKQQIFFESVGMGLDDKHDDISNLNFLKLIQLIGTSVPESHKLEAFRKNLAAFSGLGLQTQMDMWHEAIKGCNLQPVCHFFEKGLDDLIISHTLDACQDGPWIAQFFIQLYLLSD